MMFSFYYLNIMMKSVFSLFAIFFMQLWGLLCWPAQAEVNLTGELEIDTSYMTSIDKNTYPREDEAIYDLSGYLKLVPAMRKEADNLFAEAKAEFLVSTDTWVGTGDVWGKIGTPRFDVQIGRYQAWSLFEATSNDMLIVDAPSGTPLYQADYARGRMDGAGQLALHAFVADSYEFEASFVYGSDEDNNMYGLRPVINAYFGHVAVAAGIDFLNTTPKSESEQNETTKLGYGARMNAVFGKATAGIDYASGTVSGKDYDGVDLDHETTNSIGAWCEWAMGKGTLTVAGFWTNWEQDNNSYEKEHLQYFIVYAHALPIDGAAIKFAVSQAFASNDNPKVGDSEALGFKVRLCHTF
jgi:hypothetical protein